MTSNDEVVALLREYRAEVEHVLSLHRSLPPPREQTATSFALRDGQLVARLKRIDAAIDAAIDADEFAADPRSHGPDRDQD